MHMHMLRQFVYNVFVFTWLQATHNSIMQLLSLKLIKKLAY